MNSESASVQSFIDVHRNLVLRDALNDLENCEMNYLPKLLHRLKGTLGTFQFPELSSSLQEISKIIQQEHNPRLMLEKKQRAIELIKNELNGTNKGNEE